MEILKEPDVNVHAESTILRQPLHLACAQGHTKIAKVLVEKGANPNCQDFDQSTPLHCAS